MNDVYARIRTKVFIEQWSGTVGGTVIDHNDLQIFCVSSQDRRNRLHDYVFFVMSRNQNRHVGWWTGNHGLIGSKFFYQRQNADYYRAATYQNYSHNENGGEAYAEPAVQAEDESIGAGFESLLWRQGQHHGRACFVEQVRNGYELIALRAKTLDQLRQRRYGLGAITAAIVKED